MSPEPEPGPDGIAVGAVSTEPDQRRPAGRSRRAREPVARPVIQKVKLTETEREQLRTRAGELGVSVPRLLVESALSEVSWTPTERRLQLTELFEVRRLLATVANNVNQLARSANISGQVGAEQRLERRSERSAARQNARADGSEAAVTGSDGLSSFARELLVALRSEPLDVHQLAAGLAVIPIAVAAELEELTEFGLVHAETISYSGRQVFGLTIRGRSRIETGGES